MKNILLNGEGVLPRYTLLWLLTFYILFSIACTSHKQASTQRVEVQTNVPATTSEIREVRHEDKGDAAHGDLHFRGQLLTKSLVNGSIQTSPCGSCIVTMRVSGDTSTIINMSTDVDGRFSYEGQKNTFSLFLKNPGLNTLEIHTIDLSIGGKNTITIVNAKGSKVERFYLSRVGNEFKWTYH